MSCTNAGTTVKSTTKGVNVKAGTKAADAPRRQVYGQTKVGGLWAYAETTGSTNQYLHLIIILCDGPIESIDEIYFGNELVTIDGTGDGTGKWAGNTLIKKHFGTTSQAADATLVAASGGKWTTLHKLSGIAYLYVRLQNWDTGTGTPSPMLFGSVPDISAVVKGRNDILDPRTGVTDYTDNAALCLHHYRLKNNTVALDVDSVKTAANVCDETVSGRKRYVVGGMIEATASVEDVTRQFLTAMAGSITANAGGHFLRIGVPSEPSISIGWDDLRDKPSLRRTAGTGDTFTGSAATPANNWQVTDAANQNDAKSVLKLDLVNNEEQAARLVAIENNKNGPTETITLKVGPGSLDLATGDAVDIDLPPLTTGRYEVQEATLNVELVPTIDLKLERQRATLFDEVATTPATAHTLDVQPRALGAITASPVSGVYPSGDYPLSIVLTYPAGATIRWSTSSQPLTENDGSPYFGSISFTTPVGTPKTLYATAFKAGWTSRQNSFVYNRS